MRNKGGRIHFEFDSQLLRYLEGGAPPLSPPTFLAGCTSPPMPAHNTTASGPTEGISVASQWQQELACLQQQCLDADASGAGYVERLALERCIVQDCRELISQLSAAAVLDTLQANAHGATRYLTACAAGLAWCPRHGAAELLL